MPSSIDPEPGNTGVEGGDSAGSRFGRASAAWNRKLHYYLGLYLLFFLWLFSLSGLLLNHSQWKFSEFWANRKQSNLEREIEPPRAGGDLVQAREIMRQLGIRGEVDWTSGRPDAGHLNFRASRPGHIFEIKADLAKGRATVQRIELNGWGVFRILHTFTGVRMDDERNQRDWFLTSMWAFTMDAVAVGMILLVATSFYLWWEPGRERMAGMIALGLGMAICGWFCYGLARLY